MLRCVHRLTQLCCNTHAHAHAHAHAHTHAHVHTHGHARTHFLVHAHSHSSQCTQAKSRPQSVEGPRASSNHDMPSKSSADTVHGIQGKIRPAVQLASDGSSREQTFNVRSRSATMGNPAGVNSSTALSRTVYVTAPLSLRLCLCFYTRPFLEVLPRVHLFNRMCLCVGMCVSVCVCMYVCV